MRYAFHANTIAALAMTNLSQSVTARATSTRADESGGIGMMRDVCVVFESIPPHLNTKV
jgi:hypothetical protein